MATSSALAVVLRMGDVQAERAERALSRRGRRTASGLLLLAAVCLALPPGCDDPSAAPDAAGRDAAGTPSPDAGVLDALPAAEVDTRPGAPLKIVSFNVRFDNPNDGANAWPNRRDMVYRLMRELDADVAGLQEVLLNQLEDLVAALPEYQRVGVGREDGQTGGEFSAILYRASRFDVETSGNFWFSDTPEVPGSRSWGNFTTRICTWGRFVDKATGRAYYHFNVHLDNISQLSREKSVALLMQRIRERRVSTDPFIVTGDFNVGESDVAIRFMKGEAPLEATPNPLPMVDSFREVYPDATAVGTFHNFLGGTTSSPKIDFIFTRPGDLSTAAAIVLKQEDGRYPSDHYPVTATVAIAGW
jgi:endonuclease/exonuclease/phosphatase family metal-dependent hydrolase